MDEGVRPPLLQPFQYIATGRKLSMLIRRARQIRQQSLYVDRDRSVAYAYSVFWRFAKITSLAIGRFECFYSVTDCDRLPNRPRYHFLINRCRFLAERTDCRHQSTNDWVRTAFAHDE
jgi:hypothetical protein